jgi:hypothetical protein
MKLNLCLWILCGAAAMPAQGMLAGPYGVDADTVHLFHFDEAAGSVVAFNAVASAPFAIAFDGNPLASVQPFNTSILGAAGLAGFGSAADISTTDLGIGLDANLSGGFEIGDSSGSPDGVLHSSLTGTNGAFTLEALVKLPAITGAYRQIICTDSSMTLRGFQFRVDNSGNLEFNFVGTPTSGVIAAIPTSGPHAFSAANWYHAAVTFDGTNTLLYWTLADASSSGVNLIGSFSTETTLGTVVSPLVFGNDGRGISSEGLRGLIDEVRISNVARATNDFFFAALDLVTDLDSDLLPDAWETLYVLTLNTLSGLGGVDFDEDDVSDLDEYLGGSNPINALSIPFDIDGDGLLDSLEILYFGNLAQGPEDDYDGDGESNTAEIANGTAPNHRASNASDTDADFLPDDWELSYFADLSHNGGSDPDGDGFSDLQEHTAGTDPTDPASRPAGTAVKLVPLDDGNNATSDFGYAGSSAINTVAFMRSGLKTVGNQQFIAWYGRHENDAAAAFNNKIWIGRRTLGSSHWEIFRHPAFTANSITDGHDVISFGIDGNGYMHLSWGMHGDAFHYSRSLAPVTGSGPIELGPDTTMTGNENGATYPQFLSLPDGDLLYVFREGNSGSGNLFLNRYNTATAIWSNVHHSGPTQLPFLQGTGWTPNYNSYPNMPQLGGVDGDDLYLTWCFRYNGDSPAGESAYQTNNKLVFGRSTDGGLTWQRFDGTPYVLPVSRDGESGDTNTMAETLVDIPEGYSLINQGSMCLDRAGNPVIGTWWAPGTVTNDYRRQYMVAFRHDNGTWQTRPVSSRTNNLATTKYDETAVRDLGRPIVVNDDADRIIVAYRDDAGDNGITIVHSLPKAQDPDRLLWIEFDLTHDNLGNYEPVIDNELWDRDRQLHFLYQASQGEGYVPPTNTASRVSVLEWHAARYFAHAPQPTLKLSGDKTRATVVCPSEPSWSYRLWSGTELDDWTLGETRVGTGGNLEFIQTINPGEPRRFWRIERAEGGF